jgi:hypothetical protein
VQQLNLIDSSPIAQLLMAEFAGHSGASEMHEESTKIVQHVSPHFCAILSVIGPGHKELFWGAGEHTSVARPPDGSNLECG